MKISPGRPSGYMPTVNVAFVAAYAELVGDGVALDGSFSRWVRAKSSL